MPRSDLFLIDSSVWLEVLPPRPVPPRLAERIDALLAADAVATVGIVRLEILTGARNDEDYRRLIDLLSPLHLLETTREMWDEAAHLGFRLRRQGLPVPSSDLLIAAAALGSDIVLVHRDRHFDLIAQHVPLRVESYVP